MQDIAPCDKRAADNKSQLDAGRGNDAFDAFNIAVSLKHNFRQAGDDHINYMSPPKIGCCCICGCFASLFCVATYVAVIASLLVVGAYVAALPHYSAVLHMWLALPHYWSLVHMWLLCLTILRCCICGWHCLTIGRWGICGCLASLFCVAAYVAGIASLLVVAICT
jgi:hypothetical protein